MDLEFTRILVLASIAISLTTAQRRYRRVCYFANWSQYNDRPYNFLPDDIDPSLCTHIMFAFATILNGTLTTTEPNDDSTPWRAGLYERLTEWKYISNVRVLLSVGGFSSASAPFTEMVANSQSRELFVNDTIEYLRANDFDGLDIDWEYPAHRGSPAGDRWRFVLLVNELHSAFYRESRRSGFPRLLLTCAVAAPPIIADKAYDIETMYRFFDFVTLMTYDFHGGWEQRTGHNSPMYPRVDEVGVQRTLNLHSSATYWVDSGAIPQKTNIGIALYGRTFNLTDPNNNGMGAPVYGDGQPAIIEYYKVCELIDDNATLVWNSEQEVPYLYKDNLWVGYDDPESVRLKVEYVRRYGFGGTSVWVLHSDDWRGVCGDRLGLNPLMKTIRNRLRANPVP